MRLNFRQGIVKHQTDQNGTSQFLRHDPSRKTVSIVIHDIPTLISFCHRDSNYLIEESISIDQAWVLPDENAWLYWDINLQSSLVSRGTTIIKPVLLDEAPNNPILDQHWFDSSEMVMKVWDGNRWNEKLRVFAAHFFNGRVIPFPVGSQVGNSDANDAGFILLDPFQLPIRYKPTGEPNHWYGRFLTSESWITVANRTSKLSKIDSGNFSVVASEPIPKFSFVQMKPDRRVELARHTDHTTRVNGIILEDMYKSDISDLFCHGFISNEDWNWPDESINKSIYCGAHGEPTLDFPKSGVYQQVGFVYDRNSIFVDLMPVIVLDEIQDFNYDQEIVNPPIANFAVDIVEGFAPLTVKFTSLTEDASNWEWDFQNNDSWDAVGKEKTFIFENPGAYTVKHRVSNQYGSDVKIAANLIKVLEAPTQELRPNLKIKLSAIGLVKSGVTFKIRCFIENVGSGIANQVVRKITARTDTGVDVIVVNSGGGLVSKMGAGSSTSPKITTIQYQPFVLNSMEQNIVEIELKVDSYAKSVIIGGLLSTVDESNEGDNETKIQLPVRF